MSTFRPITVVTLLLVATIERAISQEESVPLIGEVVVVAEVFALHQTGALGIRVDGEQKELWLDTIRLPSKESTARKKADELLESRLLGKSVEVHILASGDGGGEKWIGYTLDGEVDVRLELIGEGLARYCRGNRREPEFELRDRQARESGKGIWSKDQKRAIPLCEGAA